MRPRYSHANTTGFVVEAIRRSCLPRQEGHDAHRVVQVRVHVLIVLVEGLLVDDLPDVDEDLQRLRHEVHRDDGDQRPRGVLNVEVTKEMRARSTINN